MLNPTKVGQQKAGITSESLPKNDASGMARLAETDPAVVLDPGDTPRCHRQCCDLNRELLNSRAHELTEDDGRIVARLELELQDDSNLVSRRGDADLIGASAHQ